MFPKEWDNYFSKVVTVCNLITVTILVIFSFITLKVHVSASKEFFQFVQNCLVAFDEFYVEPWFYFYSSYDFLLFFWITDIHRKTSFSIY